MVPFAAALVASIGLQSAADVYYDIFATEALRCVIGNNVATGVHRAGYNGIFELTTPPPATRGTLLLPSTPG